MTLSDWAGTPENWVFLVIGLGMLFAGFRVVTSPNVVHAVLYLVVALGGSAALFLLLGAEFVAWTVVLVYIGAVVVLFLFGIMITRAPVGREVQLSHPIRVRVSAAIVAFALFVLLAASVVGYFEDAVVAPSAATRTDDIGQAMFERFVMPFEVVSIVLLAALIGGIVLARRDPTEESEALR
ncbi:MAG TPA: NADH-quinone oxidoreductase subunit J [Acidimicrobiia bacterium]